MSEDQKSKNTTRGFLCGVIVSFVFIFLLSGFAYCERQANQRAHAAKVYSSQVPSTDINNLYSNYLLQAQQDVALWNYAMFIVALGALGVTVVGIFYVAQTLNATRIAAEATVRADKTARKVGEAQSRAYLAARKGQIRINTNSGEINFTAEIFNFGNSPASKIHFYGISGLGPRNVYYPRKILIRPVKCISEIPVNLFREVRGQLSIGCLEPEFGIVREGNVYFYLAGNLSYEDVFGKRHKTKIAFSGYTDDEPLDTDGYVQAKLNPTNPSIWDQTGNGDPTS